MSAPPPDRRAARHLPAAPLQIFCMLLVMVLAVGLSGVACWVVDDRATSVAAATWKVWSRTYINYL